jgi:hypothetical protein
MKIAFVGDSYCADQKTDTWSQQSWLDLVLKKYNAEMICKGQGGTALFHAYEDLLGIVDEADYIIFCITAYSRLPNRFGIPIDTHWLALNLWDFKKYFLKFHNGSEVLGNHHEKAIKAGELYYKDLISFKFHQVAQKGILMQMDELMIEKKKKCIWFPCFDNDLSMQEYIPKSGPIASCTLSEIAIAEYSGGLEEFITMEQFNHRHNHFNLKNNQNMANLIINIIDKDNFTPREIKMEDYFGKLPIPGSTIVEISI